MLDGEPLWRRFFAVDPYAGFDASAYPEDLQGWGSQHPIFDALIAALRPSLILEVGSWKGASAINMARIAKSLDLPAELICVDTWLGTIESYSWRERDPALHADLRLRHGWPHLYYQFLANVVHSGFADRVTPLAQTGLIGMRLLKALGLAPQLIYIDASHDYDDVRMDLAAAWGCVAEDGVIFGDDYIAWAGVTKAVHEFCDANRLPMIGAKGKFAFAKRGNIAERLGASADGMFGGLKLRAPA